MYSGTAQRPYPFMPPEPDPLEKRWESANESARVARGVHLTFLLVGVYFAILIGSTTHKQLLMESNIILPLLSVGIPIVWFYVVVPWIFILLHLNLLLLFYLLSRKLHDLCRDDRKNLKSLLYPLPFSHWLVKSQESRSARILLNLYVWTTTVILPVTLLVWAQLRFLPYHSDWITGYSHRWAVVVDLVLLWVFWPKIMHAEGRWRFGFKRNFWAGFLFLTALYLSFAIFRFSIWWAIYPDEKRVDLFSTYIAAWKWEENQREVFFEDERVKEYIPRNLSVRDEILVKEPP
ncbi:MAG: hypothetical protein HQL52_18120, partial [Magnetococcales bacterium]|nr:hypothetical protein [Magnetococcales bacterium]